MTETDTPVNSAIWADSILGKMSLDETFNSRDKINISLSEALDEVTAVYGIKIHRVEIRDIIAPADVQEAMDFSIVAHLAAIKGQHPVICAQDGFRTSHTIKKVEVLNYKKIEPYVPFEEIKAFR